MSRLKELIDELCPDGVEYKTLGEVVVPKFGERITKMNNLGTIYPVYGGGGESFRTDNYNREDEVVVSRFAMSEKCVRKVDGRFWLLDSGLTINTITDDVEKAYVWAWLDAHQREIYGCASQAAQRNLITKSFLSLHIPIPPIEVQREIVRVLDAMKELDGALSKEKNARTKQTNTIRDWMFEKQLERLCPDGVEYKLVQDVAIVMKAPNGIKRDHYGDGTIYPIIDQGQGFIVGYTDEHEKVLDYGECTIFGDHTREVKWVDFPFAVGADGVKVLRAIEGINQKYFFYAFSSLRVRNRGYNRHWTIAREMKIPVPPIEVQREIVRVLDSMQELDDALSEELNARRKQFEYYRDKLLDFPEKEV